MHAKAIGTILILSSALSAVYRYHRQCRVHQEYIEQLIWSLEHMAAEIRWRHRTLPDIFEDLSSRPCCGEMFGAIADNVKSDIPLQTAWQSAFCKSDAELAAILSHMDLTGDEKHLTEGLAYAAEELKSVLHTEKKQQKEQGKLVMALTGGGAGLLIILLM